MRNIYLDSLRRKFNIMMHDARSQSDSLTEISGKEKLSIIRENYENKSLKSLVQDDENLQKTYETSEKFIQKYNPGFMKSTNRFGRAHFFAPYKLIGSHEIDTYWFNLAVLWIVAILLYIALYYRLLQKAIDYFGMIRFYKSE
jgi:hypothetical protein